MIVRLQCIAVVTGSLVTAAACGRSAGSASNPAIRLTSPPDGGRAYVEVTGLSGVALDALRDGTLTAEQWSGILRVAVNDDAPAMLGAYSVADGAARFTPLYPLDPAC